ncbi:MAG TPA: hypothetical protein VJT49_06225 [Amycolatopsis sp.]|uniref:hypothetical protein n=1 Tax=Amycolatopsis sp. TaxID=37632 RepID=UPI002B4A4ED7|nr:hypothetical protein [Amycolatopsis sp.]HKS44703.1 hypothetical protein [Amycolatopsis sp.]
MNEQSASPGRELDGPIRRTRTWSPYAIPHQPISALVEFWSEVRIRTLLARHADASEPNAEDLFAELAYGTRIAQEATCGQWCVVVELLRIGAVDSWAQVATAIGITQTEARDRFHVWIVGQVDLRRTGSIGMTDAEAETEELYALSQAVAW